MHCRFSVLSEQFSAPKMGKANVKYLLEEHDRYLYQRKVPLDMQSSVGTKKWRPPLGPDLDIALGTRDTLREIKKQHDALIDELENPDCGGVAPLPLMRNRYRILAWSLHCVMRG